MLSNGLMANDAEYNNGPICGEHLYQKASIKFGQISAMKMRGISFCKITAIRFLSGI